MSTRATAMELKAIGKAARWLILASLVGAGVNIFIFWDVERLIHITLIWLAIIIYYGNAMHKRSRNETASWMGNVILPGETNLDPFMPWFGAILWVAAFVLPHYWYWTK
jgi:hypothetical protein